MEVRLVLNIPESFLKYIFKTFSYYLKWKGCINVSTYWAALTRRLNWPGFFLNFIPLTLFSVSLQCLNPPGQKLNSSDDNGYFYLFPEWECFQCFTVRYHTQWRFLVDVFCQLKEVFFRSWFVFLLGVEFYQGLFLGGHLLKLSSFSL